MGKAESQSQRLAPDDTDALLGCVNLHAPRPARVRLFNDLGMLRQGEASRSRSQSKTALVRDALSAGGANQRNQGLVSVVSGQLLTVE